MGCSDGGALGFEKCSVDMGCEVGRHSGCVM